MSFSPQAEALIQVARKRQLQNQIGCARLRVLLSERGVRTLAQARSFLQDASLLPGDIAEQLRSRLPHDEVRMGGYQLLAHLAEGGMGSAWLACRSHLMEGKATESSGIYQAHNLVVIKTIKAKYVDSEEVHYRFERELRFMAVLRHPHVVSVLDHGIHHDGTLFMVLEYVPEGDLKDLIALEGRLPEALALSIAYQLADALGEAHKHQLIHRDIKPANIFICTDYVCKLADFGLARSTSSDRTALTVAGETLGSVHYMSPEQARGDADLDIRSDLYALGCVLFYCLCGSKPFVGDMQTLMQQHRFAPVPDPRQFRTSLAGRTADIVVRLMAKDRCDRFQTPELLRKELADSMHPLGEAAPEPLMPITVRMTRPPVEDADPTAPTRHPAQVREADPFPATLGTSQGGAAAEASPFPGGPGTPALDTPWITLAGDGCLLFLYARHQLILGKLCEPPADICIRKYPIERFRRECMRISRLHLDLRFDPVRGVVTVTDRDSGNGTLIDGRPLPAYTPVTLRPGVVQALRLADAVDLRIQAIGRHPSRPGAAAVAAAAGGDPPLCGLECPHVLDACVIRRCENRPGMAYAMVLRRLSVGAEGSDLPLPDAQGAGSEVAIRAGRWVWRPLGEQDWAPLYDGTEISAADKFLVARPGDHAAF